MATPFHHTLRSLGNGTARTWSVAAVATLLLLATWMAWFFFAKIQLVLTSDVAWIESSAPVFRLDAPVDGRVQSVVEGVGREVAAEEVLLQLDSSLAELQLEEFLVELVGWKRRLAGLRNQPKSSDRWQHDLAEASTESERLEAAAQRQRAWIALHSIRSPSSGRLAETPRLRPGQWVRAGDWVASVLPDSPTTVLARFPADPALGQIEVGDPATIYAHRIDPPFQTPRSARVLRVALDAREGSLHLELEPAEPSPPLPHGSRLTVDVEVARVSPAQLVLHRLQTR